MLKRKINLEDENIQSNSLSIELVTDCNLHCPWCVGVNTTNEGIWSEDVFQKFCTHIKNKENHYLGFIFTGGEPLLYKKHFLRVLNIIRKYSKDSLISCLTNGILLDEEYVKIFNVFKICAKISLQLYGFKNLEMALKLNPKFINLIKQLTEDTHFRCVLTRPLKPFSFEINRLNNIFKDYRIEIGLDLMDLINYTLDDIIFIEEQLKNVDNIKNIKLLCSCEEENRNCLEKSKTFLADGSIGTISLEPEEKSIRGCIKCVKQMDPEIYSTFIKLGDKLRTVKK